MRVLSPAIADKALHRKWGNYVDGDPFNYLAPTSFGTAVFFGVLMFVGGVTGVWLPALLAVIPLAALGWLIKFTLQSSSCEYSWNRTPYYEAYMHYRRISNADSLSLARPLLEKVWEHQNGVDGHSSACGDCLERIDLLGRIKAEQPQGIDDKSDIEHAKMVLDIRKELSA